MDKTKEYLEHIGKLLRDSRCPELPHAYADDPAFVQIHEELKSIREITQIFSTGDFSTGITGKSYIHGSLKTLQANMRHLIWQAQMVEKGDYTQEVHFMGDFSEAFNNMVQKLRQNLLELQEKEKNLTESEARFKFLASRDHLTGIYNRRSFIELAEHNLENAAKRSVPCCLAMMDIDHFKKFNDNYGHLAGDDALRHTVKVIEARLRKGDFMGRYGGEEFILFFYNTDEMTGFKIVERLRLSLAENPVLLESGPVNIYASFGLVVTFMESPKDKDYVDKLINDADAALYAAKKAGRNRVIIFSPDLNDK